MVERVVSTLNDFKTVCEIVKNEQTAVNGRSNTVIINLTTPLPQSDVEKAKALPDGINTLKKAQNELTTQRMDGHCASCKIRVGCNRSQVWTQRPTQHLMYASVEGLDIKPKKKATVEKAA